MRKLLTLLVILLIPSLAFGYGTEVSNYTDIYGYDTAKGYRIYAASLSTQAVSSTGVLVVASSSGKTIKILGYDLSSSVASNLQFKSATGSLSTTGDTMAGCGPVLIGATSNFGRAINIARNQTVILCKGASGGALYLTAATSSWVSGNVFYLVE